MKILYTPIKLLKRAASLIREYNVCWDIVDKVITVYIKSEFGYNWQVYDQLVYLRYMQEYLCHKPLLHLESILF